MSAPQHFGLLSGQHSIVLLDVKLDRTSAKIDKDALGRKATMGQGQESVRVAVGDMCKFFCHAITDVAASVLPILPRQGTTTDWLRQLVQQRLCQGRRQLQTSKSEKRVCINSFRNT